MMSNELTSVEKHSVRHLFPKECEQLPYNELKEEEQYLVDKCIEKEYFTKEEYLDLSRLLYKYRPHLQKYKDIEENLKSNQEVIKSEKLLLDLLDDENNYKFKYKLHIGVRTAWVNLKVKPLTDSRLNQSATDHLRLLSDLSEQERLISDKAERQEPLTVEEEKILTSVNKKFEAKVDDEDFMKIITEQLNNQVVFVDFDFKDELDSLDLWYRISGADRVTIWKKANQLLNLQEEDEEALFLFD